MVVRSATARMAEGARRFVIPAKGATIAPRLMGQGPAEVWLDDVSLVKTGTISELQNSRAAAIGYRRIPRCASRSIRARSP